MSRQDPLGSYIRPFHIDDQTTIFCRGLKVREYHDFVDRGGLDSSVRDSFYSKIAIACIEGWKNIYKKNSDGEIVGKIEYEEGKEELLDIKHLKEIGKFCFQDLTLLKDDEKEKIKGFINFLYWKSEDENEQRAKTFDCETCLESGKAITRPCGLYSREKRINYNKENESDDTTSAKDLENRRNRYGMGKKTYVSKENYEDVKEEREYMHIGNFKFPECPISWVDSELKVICETLYHSEKSERNYFDGGVADQLYKIYKMAVLIKNEYGKIEEKKMEENRKDNKVSRTNSNPKTR